MKNFHLQKLGVGILVIPQILTTTVNDLNPCRSINSKRAVNNFSNIANMKLGSLHFNHRGCESPGEGIREHSPPRTFLNLDAWRSYFQHSSLFSLIQSVLKTSPESCLAPLSETL